MNITAQIKHQGPDSDSPLYLAAVGRTDADAVLGYGDTGDKALNTGASIVVHVLALHETVATGEDRAVQRMYAAWAAAVGGQPAWAALTDAQHAAWLAALKAI